MTQALVLAVAVIVRTYNYAQVPPDQLAAARSTANRIFQSAGISLQWIDCRVPDDRRWTLDDGRSTMEIGRSSCMEPLRDGQEFVLRLMGLPAAPSNGSTALGTSLIDGEGRSGVLMTVDPRQVSAIARSALADSATLLGRAVAHEIGHLLLGHPNHSRSGLMRALWSQNELRGSSPADWQFSSTEAARMRQGLLARTRAAN